MWNLKTLLFFEFEDDLELSMSNSSLSNLCKSTLLTGVAGNFILGPWWCLNQPAKRVQVGNLVRTLLAMAMALSLSAFMALRSFLSTGSGTALHFKKHNGPAVATQVFGQRCVKINCPSFILGEQSEFYGIYCCIVLPLPSGSSTLKFK